MRRELIGLAVVLLGSGCGTETKYIAHATPQAKACGEYAQLLQSIDRYCGLDCDDTCRHGYFDQCFEGTEPAQVEQIDRCAEVFQ